MIERNLSRTESVQHDLIIVGGGVFGIMLALEATLRNLRWVLLEKGDFGSQASHHHHRILHGGLRYLQNLDLPRFRQSVQERSWFLRTFPDFATPLPCLMPLYGKGLKRTSVFRLALGLNDFLARHRNLGLDPSRRLPRSGVISPGKTLGLAPEIAPQGLEGGAVWYDGSILESQRILMETLRFGCSRGGVALNYCQAEKVSATASGSLLEVRARDVETGNQHVYSAAKVILAAGSWSRELTGDIGLAATGLFPEAILMWNLLVDRPPFCSHALALFSENKADGAYFLHPWKGRLLIGTGQMPWKGGSGNVRPSPSVLGAYLADINRIIPSLELAGSDVLRVFAGLVPGNGKGELRPGDVFIDHGARGGTKGMYSISGVKFTTARAVADQALRKVFPTKERLTEARMNSLWKPDGMRAAIPSIPEAEGFTERLLEMLRPLIAEEAVLHLDDLLLRRCSLGDLPARALSTAERVGGLFPWDEGRRALEMLRLRDALGFQNL